MINASVIIIVIERNIVSWKLRKESRRKNRQWLSMPAFLASMLQTALETAAFRSTYLRLAPEQCTAKGSANEAIS